MSTLASPILQLDRDAATSAKRDQFGVAGWTVAGATVDILFDGVKLSTVTADANGRYTYQLAQWPAAGAHDIVAVAHGADGQTASSSTLRVDIGSQAPAAPTVTSAYYGNFLIHADTTVLYGQTSPAATVRVLANGEFLIATRADATGFWFVDLPPMADGFYSFRATATTASGTTGSAASWNVRVDEDAPEAPVLMLGNDPNAVLSGEHAAFSGTAEALAVVTLSIDGVARGQAVAGADGRWAIAVDLPPGTYRATATATDTGAHVSAPSAALSFAVKASNDEAGDASTKAQLPVGASVQGVIDTAGDHDWFKVTLESQVLYRFTLKAAESNAGTLRMLGSGMYQDYLHLWDPQAAGGIAEVGQGSPTRQGEPVTILFAPTRSGDYFLDMGSGYDTGSYTLSAELLARDDHANDSAHATALPLATTRDGVIDYAGDVDQFSLALRAGVSYTVALDSGGAAYGSVLRALALSDGPSARVAGDSSSWDGVLTMTLVPSVDGIYTVRVSGGTGDTVPYHIRLTEAKDDYVAGIATTGRVLPGTLARGTLESRGDADWFKASLKANQSYLLQALDTDGRKLDLDLFDGAGKALGFDQSTVYGSDSMLWRAPASGDYYFQVSDTFSTGAYTLLVTPAPADDFGATVASAGTLTPAGVSGALETPLDADWLKLTLSAGTDYVFTLDSSTNGHTLQSPGQLRLLDGAGAQLAVATRGSPSYSAQLVFHAARSGEYVLEVSDPSSRNIGSYGVSMVANDQDTLRADAGTDTSLAPGGMVAGKIDYATDADWVRVDLKAGRTYEFELTGTVGRGGTLPSNTMSLNLVNASGAIVAYQNYQFGQDPTVGVRPNADTTYYLAVSASGSATGSYTLKASDSFTPYLDTLPPLLRTSVLPSTPQVLEKNVPMVIYFDEVVRLGEAEITLHMANGDLVERFTAGAGNASLPEQFSSLSLTSRLLEYGTDYVLTLAPGSIVDNSKHAFAGTTLTFRTADAPPRQDGSPANDVFYGRNGNEIIDGKGGRDTVLFKGAAAGYTLSQVDGVLKVDALSGAQGHDTLLGIERVVFQDLAIAYDTDGNAGQAFRLYRAAFDRMPDAGGLGYWIAQLDHGIALRTVADGFLLSAEFASLYGAASSDMDFVKALYGNVLHRTPDQSGVDYWYTRLQEGVSRPDVLVAFSESTENQAALIGQIAKGMPYQVYD